MIRIVVVISLVATLCHATASSVKRDEYGTSGGSSNSQPVYSPSASSSASSYSSGGSSASGYPSSGSYGNRDAAGSYSSGSQYPSGDQHQAASSSSYNQAPPSSQGNLYYYYYPVQEKGKGESSSYQASPSNQYSSAISSGFGSSASSSDPAHSSLEPAASGQDLSYSAQDLSYSAQSLGQGLGQGMSQGIGQDYGSQGSGSNYDQQLSSLASQLQQYAFNPSSYGSSASPSSGSGQGYGQGSYDGSGSGNSYGAASSPSASFGAQGEGQSGHSYPSSSHPSYSAAGANAAAAAAAAFGSQSGGQIPYGTFGQSGYGNYAAASGPQASYEPATSGYRRYGLSSILMPMLALAGLSLLIPTVTSLGSSTLGRRKRSTEESAKETAITGYLDRIERYYSIYRTAVEKEECMNRIICELGDAMSGVRGKNTVLTVLEKVVPTWMGTKMGVFKNAALTNAEYGKCKKYTC